MPVAIVRIATAVKPGVLSSERTAILKSGMARGIWGAGELHDLCRVPPRGRKRAATSALKIATELRAVASVRRRNRRFPISGANGATRERPVDAARARRRAIFFEPARSTNHDSRLRFRLL